MTGPPPSLGAIGDRVAHRIDRLLQHEQERWSAVDAKLADPYEALRGIVGGGKRLRPAFCHWGFVAAGGDPDDPRIVDAGAAVELLHTMAVVHDDIMDDSTRRHGRPCLHVEFADRHRLSGWQGETRRFGDGAAILIGDVAFVYADQMMRMATPQGIERRAEVEAVFDEMRLEVNVGQWLDLVGTASGDTSVDDARTIAVYKSGKYTIERPLHLGVALAASNPGLREAFTRYGIPLGEAFQLRDDVLDVFGDRETMGKDTGEDIRSGKPTRLLALARERAGRRGEAMPDAPDALRMLLVETGVLDEVEQRVATLREEALGAIDDVPQPARSELQVLAHFVTTREG